MSKTRKPGQAVHSQKGRIAVAVSLICHAGFFLFLAALTSFAPRADVDRPIGIADSTFAVGEAVFIAPAASQSQPTFATPMFEPSPPSFIPIVDLTPANQPGNGESVGSAADATGQPETEKPSGIDGASNPDDSRLTSLPQLDRGQRVLFLVDCSSSMARRGLFARVQRLVLASLHRLEPDRQFQVLAFRTDVHPLMHRRWCVASTGNLDRAAAAIMRLTPEGSTDTVTAIRVALSYSPDVLLLITDGGGQDFRGIRRVAAVRHKHCPIHILQVGVAEKEIRPSEPLRRIAVDSRGTFQILTFPTR